ncbi:MAG: class I SAM-dependent methyltransferase [Parvibaculum sp.]|uniref:class I SAM-dependent methyltransferase n=1 Tax=Parvibaculum sp. TaxID=2024848 RepID=UPI003265FD12
MDNTQSDGYQTKPPSYFSGVRADYVGALPVSSSAAILELGCARGGTGHLALQSGKCGRYVGIEMHPEAAAEARKHLTEVLVGDVEHLEFPWPAQSFDALILSEVLEHLVDPWTVLGRLAVLLKPGAVVMASSPNISHYRIVLGLLRGQWQLEERGAMDRTHLRWFTPASFRQMFEEAGFAVTSVEPLSAPGRKARILNALTGNRFRHLFMTQINLHGYRIREP